MKKIILVFALYIEAKPFLHRLHLKKRDSLSGMQIFENEKFVAIITGTGKVSSAVGTAYLLSQQRFGVSQTKQLCDMPLCFQDITGIINIGICGGKNQYFGDIFMIDQIFDHNAQRRFYPDVFFNRRDIGLSFSSLRTVSIPESNQSFEELIDMEGSGFFEAASNFFPAHKIQLIKMTSDQTDTKILDKKKILQMIEKNVPKVLEIMEHIFPDTTENSDLNVLKPDIKKIFPNIHFTVTQKIEAEKLLSALFVHNIPKIEIKKKTKGNTNAKDILQVIREELKKQ